jgi:dTDP-4-dehydrorhamnose reductase
MKNILVTGGNGQLASSIKDVALKCTGYRFVYVDVDELDITDPHAVAAYFSGQKFDFCINCAAYTAVDKAESESELCESINVTGVRNLVLTCDRYQTTFIQISTDFVFNGTKTTPYKEGDPTDPLGVYGLTKLKGEQETKKSANRYFILRTSWLYSEYGHNFLKTMIRLGNERDELKVVSDQKGTPTYARDLAEVLIKLISGRNIDSGIYHYSNAGEVSWYGFAREIFLESGIDCELHPINTSEYPTPASRPAYSVLDKSKISHALDIHIPDWKDSLKQCIKNLKSEHEIRNSP